MPTSAACGSAYGILSQGFDALLATDLDAGEPRPEGEEVGMKTRAVTPAELDAMILGGEIDDARVGRGVGAATGWRAGRDLWPCGRSRRSTAATRARSRRCATTSPSAALMRRRVQVEVEWLLVLAPQLDAAPLRRCYEDFSDDDAAAIKAIEQRTNHDVKAVEYFLREPGRRSPTLRELVHFA